MGIIDEFNGLETYKKITVIVALILVLCVLWKVGAYIASEGFSDNHEKAGEIVGWFNKNGSGADATYTEFRDHVVDTDVVEYTEAKKLHTTGGLTVENMIKKL
jgi:hypothetical protein